MGKEESFFMGKFIFFLALSLSLAFWSRQEAVLGMVLGSFLVAFLFIVGLKAIFAGPLLIRGRLWYQILLGEFLLFSLPLLFLMDRRLSRAEGILLLILGLFLEFFPLVKKGFSPFLRPAFWIIFFLAAAAGVGGGFLLGQQANFSFLSGFLFLSFLLAGSEFGDFFRKKGGKSFSLDCLLENLVFMALVILGGVGTAFPFVVQTLWPYLLGTLFFLLAFVLLLFFAWTKKRIDRHEGLLLILAFIIAILLIV